MKVKKLQYIKKIFFIENTLLEIAHMCYRYISTFLILEKKSRWIKIPFFQILA
jgi:hypothetical protein